MVLRSQAWTVYVTTAGTNPAGSQHIPGLGGVPKASNPRERAAVCEKGSVVVGEACADRVGCLEGL